ncbi:hypothetical protein [Paenibacillus sp. MMO-177]|uniref:hypothetical protein n=1 Tax=Paenibacillus sp. MMO-177 TaxID=3081289 RepID=UPI00301B62AC
MNVITIASRRKTGIGGIDPTDRTERLEQLVESITSKNMMPEDRYEIAAMLESMGWNDDRASEVFGVADVFELASEVWETIRQKVITTAFVINEETGAVKTFYELFKSFLRGLIFALPMAISVISMLTLKFSFWSYENLSVELATCIAIGTILSFVVVGGYTQAIARRGFFYILQGYFNMARKVTFQFIRYGYLTCLAVSALIYVFNLLFNIFPTGMFLIIALYFFFLNSIWLSVTVMYILRRELTFTGLIISGIAIVYVMFRVLKWDIIFSQLVSICIVSIVGMVLVLYYFKQAERREEKGIAPRMTRLSISVYSIMPYFTYGMLYFAFLFIDRVMAWSANDIYMPYFIWFRGEYELGLDFALLALMLPLGVCEVIVNKLMMEMEASYKRYWGFEAEKMNRRFLNIYHKAIFIISIVSALSAVLMYYMIGVFNQLYLNARGKPLIASDTTMFVFIIALAAYALLAVGLMNAVTLFSLSQPKFVNRAIIPAFGTNLVVGFLLSRWVDHSYAVFGLLAGAVVFLVLSLRSVRTVLRKLDYYLYAMS